MINPEFISTIYQKLNNLTKDMPESPEEYHDKDALTPVRNLCLRLLDKYYGDIPSLKVSELVALKKDIKNAKFLLEISQTPKQHKANHEKWYELNLKLERHYTAESLDQALLISSEEPDTMNLITLTNCFNKLAHSPNRELTKECYDLKERTLTELIKNINPNNVLVVPASNKNANSTVYIKIKLPKNINFLSYHAKNIPPTKNVENNETYKYFLRQIHLRSDFLRLKNQNVTEENICLVMSNFLNNSQYISEMWTETSRGEYNLDEILEYNQKAFYKTTEFAGGGTYEPLIEEHIPLKDSTNFANLHDFLSQSPQQEKLNNILDTIDEQSKEFSGSVKKSVSSSKSPSKSRNGGIER